MRGKGHRARTSALAIGSAAFTLSACGNVVRGGDPPSVCNAETTITAVESAVRDARVLAYDRFATGISADAYGVYWTTSDGLRVLEHGTAEARTLFARDLASPVPVSDPALDEDVLYFQGVDGATGTQAILRIARDGTDLRRLVFGLSPENVRLLPAPVLDAERVYFPHSTGRIAAVPKLGGKPVETEIEISGLRGLTVDDGHLYWLTGDDDASDLKRTPTAGGASETLATGFKRASQPRVVGESVFLIAEHGLFAVPKTGGCARTLLRHPEHHGVGFHVESDHIYYKRVFESDTGQSSIVRAPGTGGNGVELTKGDLHSVQRGLAFHAQSLYWTSDAAVYAFDL